MKKIKLVTIFYIGLMIFQFCYMKFTVKNIAVGFESSKGLYLFEQNNPELIQIYKNSKNEIEKREIEIKLAKAIRMEELKRLVIDCELRNFVFNDEDKKSTAISANNKMIDNLIKSNPNSYEILELQHENNVFQEGYDHITFVMEKIFKLTSLEFLLNQINYYFMIITTIMYLIYLILVKNYRVKSMKLTEE